ncbi:MAG: hypothetical protein LBN00_11995 [Oscillospiraceae bacterium]|jgi:adenylate kinase family enzyme|nr:hypothetical protein [Oscillospiraceae bacterium]
MKPPGEYNRIIVVGSPCSGKSTLARRLAARTGHTLIHLDMEFHQPNWVPTPRPEWIAKQERLVAGERWIIDGNYNGTMELRFAAADLVIFLDVPRVVCIWRELRRRGTKRSDLPDYLEEPPFFSKDHFEFLKWIWDYPKRSRGTVLSLHEKYADTAFLHLKGRRKMKKI